MAATLETALYLAARGFYIAPLLPNSKLPAGHWREQSTIDVQTIRDWFIDPFMGWPQAINILIDTGKSGLCVIDVDNKNGKPGLVNWLQLIEENAIPDTYTVETPSGGLHYYYRGQGYSNTAEKIASGIDTRGEGGYVVGPSSTLDGKEYKLIKGGETEDLPEALREKLSAHRVSDRIAERGKVITEDDPGDIQWAIDFLQDREGAIQGAHGDTHTYKTFCMLKERGLSQSTALDMAWEHWNARCSPPWDYDEFSRKCENAYKSAQNATGVKSAIAEFTVPDIQIPNGLEFELFQPAVKIPLSQIPKRDWVLGDLALRRNLTVIAAPPGASKSTLTLLLALIKASGKDLAGINPRGQGCVALYNNEDDLEELNRRTGALMQAYGVQWEELEEFEVLGKRAKPFLYLSSGEKHPFRIAERAAKGGKLKPAHADAAVTEIKGKGIDLVIIDPLAETHPAKENENEEMGEVARMYRLVAQRSDSAIILVHHTRKHDNASSEGHSGSLDAIRGASALAGVVRIALTLFTMNSKQAKMYGIAPEDMWRYVLLEQAKSNMAPGNANQMWFKREGEAINITREDPDGENIGILRRVYLRAEGEDLNPSLRNLISDIESLVAEERLSVADIAKDLVEAFHFHQGKQPRTLEKAIHRLFNDEKVCTGITGVLFLEEDKKDNRSKKYIRFERYRAPISIADML